MVRELEPCLADRSSCPKYLSGVTKDNGVKFYSYSANASDELLLPEQGLPVFDKINAQCPAREANSDGKLSIESFFGRYNISFQRPLSADRGLAQGLTDELHKRLSLDGHDYNVVLISEWDTFYGQTLPKDVISQICQKFRVFKDGKSVPNAQIAALTYLRGLDGQLPAREGSDTENAEKTPAPPAASQGEKENNAENFFKTQRADDKLDRPVGQGQYDYLRRMNEQLQRIDGELRLKRDGEKIDAIGVLGSDVFDKLLLLRALRPRFPEVLFFTTGFDEAFTMQSELLWTRNLIISSSFGPRLSRDYQGQIPSFRDAGQSQAFLATQLAIDDVAPEVIKGMLLAGQDESAKKSSDRVCGVNARRCAGAAQRSGAWAAQRSGVAEDF